MKKHKALPLIILLLLCQSQSAFRQDNGAVRRGVKAYDKGDYEAAAQAFGEALKANPANEIASFDLGNAQYRAQVWDAARQHYEQVGQKSATSALRQNAFYNQGNVYLNQQQYDKAVEAYKQAVRLDPQDADARYNLNYALEKKQQQQNQSQKQQNQDKEQQQEKQEEQQPDNQPKNQDKPDDSQQKETGGQPKENQPQPSKLSQKEAEQLMEALKGEEEKVRQRYQKARGNHPHRLNSGKDW